MVLERQPRIQKVEVLWLGPSSNKLFGRGHWRERKAWNDEGHKQTWLAVRSQKVAPVGYLVDLEFTAYMTGSGALRDTGNNSLSAKIIEDGLVKSKILVDDAPKYVNRFICNPAKRSPKGKPWDFIEVLMIEVL